MLVAPVQVILRKTTSSARLVVVSLALLATATATLWADDPKDDSNSHSSEALESVETTTPLNAGEAKGKLPWEVQRGAGPSHLPGRQIKNAREMLELLGVDSSQWNNFFQGEPLGPADEEWIIRILYLLPRVGNEFIYKWRKTQWQYADILAQPTALQGEIFTVRGHVVAVQTIKFPEEISDRYEFDHYFRATVEMPDGHTAVVCAREVPKAWHGQSKLREAVQLEGIFLKAASSPESLPESSPKSSLRLVFATQRIAWYPESSSEELGVSSEAVDLAAHGFDLDLWDMLDGRNMRGIGGPDREPFYGLLRAMRETDAAQWPAGSAPPIDIAKVLPDALAFMGQRMTVEGAVRRIEEIPVTDNDIRTRLGIDRYYTLYVFVPLRNQVIRWTRERDDPHPRVFENSFPVTVCVASLPKGLEVGNEMNEHVRARGVFYRIWSYKPQDSANSLPQPSPLLIATSAYMVPRKASSSSMTNIILGVVFFALVAVAGIVVWRSKRGDAKFRAEVMQKASHQAANVDLRDLGQE